MSSANPGQRIEPSAVAEKMIIQINTKHEAVQVAEPEKPLKNEIKIDDSNNYIDIKRYFIEKYQNI